VRDLRPSQLDDLGLVAALEYLADSAMKQLGLEVKVHIQGERYRLDPLVETSLYRIAQEALTNTARHAGVHGAQIEMSFEPNYVILILSDQGIGFSLGNIRDGGWGLAGIRERAELIGADLTIQSDPGQGTRIVIKVAVEDAKLITTSHEERKIING
jgi:signal transduction histidine kinase